MKSVALTVMLALTVFYAYPAKLPKSVLRQGTPSQADRIEALKVAYITEQLNLSPSEAQKFWPLYNSYKNDLQSIHKNYVIDKSKLTAEQQLDLEQKKLDLKRRYKPQFETALGTEKLNQLYNLERKFQEKLKEIREQRVQQRNTMGGTRYNGRQK